MNIKKLIKLMALGVTSLFLSHFAYAEYGETNPLVQNFIQDMTSHYGFAQDNLERLFKQVKKQQAILDLIAKPAERAKPWKEYQSIFLTPKRVEEGLVFWEDNEDILAKAEEEYGVPAQIIVAIIGVETFYGRNMGSWPVLDALATLSFDYPPRSAFFTKQLREYLLMTREEQLDPSSLKGSYAGAMGMCQFMPGSFRAYAVDFDEDGHINIWTNKADAIGSVANYFKVHGWQRNHPVVLQAQPRGDNVASGLSAGLTLDKTTGELAKLGWLLPQSVSSDLPAMAFRLEGKVGEEYWIGLSNFQVITRYNRSVMYSLAVYQLSEQLLAAKVANE